MFIYSEFGILFIFVVIASIFSIFLFAVSIVFTSFDTYSEKLTPYECGFDPFEDARSQFDVRFYLVAILFLIFDLEASFLIPWAVCLGCLGNFGYWVIIDFFVELVVGFYYVWVIGALDWE